MPTPNPSIRKDARRTTRKEFLKRYAGLVDKRSSYISHWREISEVTVPRQQRFLYENKSRGTKVNGRIINSTATRALRINSSGMMSGICSPARPWFRLTFPYPEVMNSPDVRAWLHETERRLHRVFNRSNFYNVVPGVFRDLANYGTAASFLEEDWQDVIRLYVYPIGSYAVAASARQEIDTLYREAGMTVGQIGEKFGVETASEATRQAWIEGRHDDVRRILHVVEPNLDYNPAREDRLGKRWRSVWIEMEHGDPEAPPLHEGNGFHEFPAMCPRWEVSGEDEYGGCPGMDALGDIKALQQIERRKLNALDKVVNPPMVGPTSLKNARASLLSGDVTYVDATQGGQKFEPAVIVDSKIVLLREEIALHERRINEAYYVDIFLMLSQYGTTQPPTKRQVDEQHEEKMLQLGSVFQRFHDEFLDPVVARTFAIAARNGLLPEPPEEIQGMDLMVEPISIMETLQKMLGTASVERWVGFTSGLASLQPDVVDKIDVDVAVDEYADMVSLPPNIVVSGDKLAAKRAARAQREQMAALAAAAKPASDAANAAATLATVPDIESGFAGEALNQGFL